jgi:hypothetical protein
MASSGWHRIGNALVIAVVLAAGCGDDDGSGDDDAVDGGGDVDANGSDHDANGVVVDAAGSDAAGAPLVEDLGDAELAALCTAFYEDACRSDEVPLCTPECAAACDSRAMPDVMRSECAPPITVDDVETCAQLIGDEDKTAQAVCMNGGGCMIDALEELCGG